MRIVIPLVQEVKSRLNFKVSRSLNYLALLIVMLYSGSSAQAQLGDNYNLELIGSYSFDSELSDVWGYVDETGREYALVGRQDGVSIIDVTVPSQPFSVFSTPGLETDWRDIKTWGDYAYVTCECPTGLQIIDLSPLPASTSLTYSYWQDDSVAFQSAHNLFIDDRGFAYIFGANYLKSGAIVLDLNQNPFDPEFVGIYNENYLHDGTVRNDTLWASAVLKGDAQAIDVTDKSNPIIVSSWKTPGAFTHNIWFSDDGNHVFTTDEIKNGGITSYDVSNALNPTRLDHWTPPDTGIVPHNTHFINDYLVTSHYTIGLNIIDVKRPNNMLEVARYDTSPDYDYQGFHGCWGAYPWLPSGNIIATDIEEGLYIFDPTYERGCYLEGRVVDEQSGNPIFFPTVEIENETSITGSIVGKYAYANRTPDNYTITFSADDYYSKTFENVSLTKGEVTYLNVELSKWPTGVSERSDDPNELIKVYPNPASIEMTISLDYQSSKITLLSMEGRTVTAHTTYLAGGDHKIDVSGIASGPYILRVETEKDVLFRIVTIL